MNEIDWKGQELLTSLFMNTIQDICDKFLADEDLIRFRA